MAQVKIRKNLTTAQIPKYATEHAAGADLSSAEQVTIYPGTRYAVDTGLSFEIDPGYEVQIRPRSGLALKSGITVLNTPGTIDADYRGPVKVILYNSSNQNFEVNIGDRIAQMVVAQVESACFVEVEELSNTARGTGGFGSTGK